MNADISIAIIPNIPNIWKIKLGIYKNPNQKIFAESINKEKRTVGPSYNKSFSL